MLKRFLTYTAASIFGAAAFILPAYSQDGRLGMAKDKQINFQPAATEAMEKIIEMHEMVLYIITAITILILGLLFWIMIRYNKRANPIPSKTSHNTALEIIWTFVPIVILIFIAVPSIKLLYFQDEIPEGEMLIKVTGHQWYWTYEYPEENLIFDANMLPVEFFSEDISDDMKARKASTLEELQQVLGRDGPIQIYRLLDTDTRVVVPVNTTVKVLVTADDVIHSWTIPAFGFKIDAVPGKINETWFNAKEIGTYYGQCSELCGIRHAFMPIVVEVVSQEDYQAWLTRAKFFYASSEIKKGSYVAEIEAPK